MALGKKVFDVYGELHLDRDKVRQGLRDLPGEMGGDADRAGQALGRRMTDGLAKAVEASSARLAKARRAEQNATDAVKLAEVRLSEAREKGGQKASTLLALEQKLEQAHRRLSDAQANTAASTKKLDDAQRLLARSMDDIGKNIGPSAQRAGDDAGGKLALGMRMSIIRNSPLIVAGVGAVLAAGAPLMMAAATGLFAGIGIVAAAQSDRVQSAWLGTWQRVKAGAIADAGVIEPVLVRMASNVGDSFDRMRPRLQGAFAAVAPQIEVFTGGILRLAENALPGLVRAVERGMPVTQGFADFLGKTGAGLSDFFDRISSRGPAAGQVFSGLGTTIGTLLPILGELLGAGVELATIALPLLNSSLGLVLNGLNLLGPALPAVAAGFAGLRLASVAAGYLQTFALQAQFATTAMTGSAAAGTRVGAALSGFGRALPVIGVALGLLGAAFAKVDQQTSAWAAALLQGGAAAAQARKDMGDPSFMDKFIYNLTNWGNTQKVATAQTQEATAAYRAQLAAMDPVSRSKALLTQATNDLSAALNGEGKYAGDVAGAQANYDAALARSEQAASELDQAINGVTQAMIDQANQALASIDSEFAYQDSLDGLEDKQKALAEAIRDHGAASEEADDAQRAFGEGLSQTAQNAGRAKADMSGLQQGTAEYARVVQTEALAELYRLRDAFPEMTPVIDGMIGKLEAAGVSLTELGQYRPTPVVDADTGPLMAKLPVAMSVLDILAGKRPLPILDLDTNPFAGKSASAAGQIGVLDSQRPTPVANVNTVPLNTNYAGAMSSLAILSGQRPLPIANMNTSPLIAMYGNAMGSVINLANQRPTPVANLADYASGGVSKLAAKLASLQDRTIYVTTVERTVKQKASGGRVDPAPVFAAVGRKVIGPGGPTDDLVQAVGPGGTDYRLSAGEFINNAMTVAQQGDAKFAALNAGRADIVLRGDRPAARRPSMAMTAPAGAAAAPASSAGGTSVVVQRLDVHLQGFDIRDRAEVRRFAKALRDEIVALERAGS